MKRFKLLLIIALLIGLVTTVYAQESITPKAAEKQKPTLVTPDRLRDEIKASVERSQETLREEIKLSQKETESRISATLLKPLDQKIKSLEDKVNKAPPWWLSIVSAALLGSLLGFLFSQLAAYQERKRVAKVKDFTKNHFQNLKAHLLGRLKQNGGEIAQAENDVDRMINSPFVKPLESLTKEEEEFLEKRDRDYDLSFIKWAKDLGVTKSDDIEFHDEGKRYTKLLKKLFVQHQDQALELNRCFHALYLLLRVLSVYKEPDEDESVYEELYEKVSIKYRVDSISELKKSDAYQGDLRAKQLTITQIAKQLKELSDKMEIELGRVENLLS